MLLILVQDVVHFLLLEYFSSCSAYMVCMVDSVDMKMLALVVVLLAIAGCVWWDNNRTEVYHEIDSFLGIPWLKIGMTLLVLAGIVFAAWFVLKWRREVREDEASAARLKAEKRERLSKILCIDSDKLSSVGISKERERVKKELKEFTSYYFIDDLMRQQIDSFLNQSAEMLAEQKHEEEEIERQKLEEKAKESRKEEQRRLLFEKLVEELLAFKRKSGFKSTPLSKEHDECVVREAEFRLRQELKEQQELREKREEAIEYYKENSIDSEPFFEDGEDAAVYAQVREDLNSGKLNLQTKIVLPFAGQTFDKDFYRARNLNYDEKCLALSQGFRHVRGLELNSHICGGGFYIRKANDRESDYHFYMKHLFAELHPNMQVEHQIGDMRVDVALFVEDYSLGIEFETGVNSDAQLAAKIPWLKRNFSQWIFVCPKDKQHKYINLVDKKNSFCLTPKKAKEFILELLALSMTYPA
jgi:hypothetical protein